MFFSPEVEEVLILLKVTHYTLQQIAITYFSPCTLQTSISSLKGHRCKDDQNSPFVSSWTLLCRQQTRPNIFVPNLCRGFCLENLQLVSSGAAFMRHCRYKGEHTCFDAKGALSLPLWNPNDTLLQAYFRYIKGSTGLSAHATVWGGHIVAHI